MSFRSLLFIPGDSERKLDKSESVAADMLILDLEDSVAAPRKELARHQALAYLRKHGERRFSELWVRINPLDTPESLADLALVMAGSPDGIVQPKTHSPDDVVRLSHYLDAFETQHELERGKTKILPIATEVPDAIFTLGGFANCSRRLAGLTWGAEDLGAAVGSTTNKAEDGSWLDPYRLARSLCLFGAHAASVPAIDTLFADIRDNDGLRASCSAAHRDGFTGKLAIHPGQVDSINECFTPTDAEVARARRIVELFEKNPNVGTLAMDDQMLDLPHYRQAQRVVQLAADAKARRKT